MYESGIWNLVSKGVGSARFKKMPKHIETV